jgi:type I restriction enzyme M protein
MPSVAPVKKNGSLEHRRQEVQQAVKNACDQLNSDGVNARDYVEQLAWLFFLKAFDETENRLEEEATFEGGSYKRRLRGEFRWSAWAALTDKPDEMLKFVNGPLWDKLTATGKEGIGDDAVGDRFRRIFTSVRNHSRRGAAFARTVEQVNRLHFSDESDVIVLSELYENLLKQVAADSAGYAGEFYTQRHIIRAMVQVVKPGKQDRVYDPCFGTAGFLGEAAEHIRKNSGRLGDSDLKRLQNETFFGVELKPLTYLLGTMNMLLHRIEGARLEMANTLELHSANVPEKNKYSVILANPPYGGKMARELQTNFTIQSGSTEILFLQHIMANLAKGGRAAVIVPEGVLFRGGPDAKVRKKLLEEFNLHTVLSLPAGCFLPYTGVKTNVLFFERPVSGGGTKDVWYYDLTNDGFELKQTRRPVQGEQLSNFLGKWANRPSDETAWTVTAEDIASNGYDLSARNPASKQDFEHRPALELVQALRSKEGRIIELLAELEEMLEEPR